MRTILVLVYFAFASLISIGCSSSGTANQKDPKATADEPSGASARELFAKGNEHLDRGDWAKAVRAYEKALERDESRWEIHLNKAIAHSSNAEFEAAVNAVQGAINHGGEDEPRVYYNLGNIYRQRGLYEQAIKAYRTSLAHRDELDLDTLVNIGSTLTILGRHEKARTTYERAARMAPDEPRVKHGIAVLLHLQGKSSRALDAFSQLLSMAPKYAEGYYDRARVRAEANDDYRGAIEDLKQCLKLEPEGPRANRAERLIKNYRNEIEASEIKGTDASDEATSAP